MPCKQRVRDALEHAFDEAVPQLGVVLHLPFHVLGGEPGRLAEADDARDVLGAGTATALVSAAVDERGDPHAFADKERADALWPVELVGGQGE